MKDLIVTVRVPFCTARCSFCSKNIHVCPAETRTAYTKALLRELASVRDELSEYRLRTLYFTGGTPTLLPDRQLPELAGEILRTAVPADDIELTVATNPGCIGINVLSRLKDHGLSRMEFSLGSNDPFAQDLLGRYAGEDEMYVSRQILEFGQMEEFGIDILRGLPGQDPELTRSLIGAVLCFAPPAAAMIPLRYDVSTPFHQRLTARDGRTIPNVRYRSLPDEQTQLEAFMLAEELLAAEGLRPYTEFHYARSGHESLHHRLVRTDIDRIELGAGGVTVSDGMLIRNTDDLDTYIRYAGDPEHTLTEVRPLTDEEQMRAFAAGRLGLLSELSPAECVSRFGCAPETDVLDALGERGWLQEENGAWSLTPAGKCFAPQVFEALNKV